LTETLRLFEQWLIDEQLISADAQSPTHFRWIIVTCGDWDLSSMLVRDCAQQNIDVPWYCRRWINVKRSYADATGTFPRSMMTMIDDLQLKHVGRQHSGIDDCRNITAIVRHLAERGDFVFEQTSGEHLMY
jgi:inhibitor of KinA sporulation pathway (predicted exonuclease)